ncbi:MAG TPA: dienelactone hydrolase family protein [Acidimicrobiia bacterium]
MSNGDVDTTNLELATPDGPMRCYGARPAPERPSRGGVVVIQEAFGVNAHIEDVTRRFASAGYHALAPHVFHRSEAWRSGDGCAPYGDFSKVIPLYEGLTDEGIIADVDATLDHLRAGGSEVSQIGIVGFCFGGRVAFLVALERRLGAAVSFYGGGIVTQRFPQFPSLIQRTDHLQTPWLGLFGARDESIPMTDVEELKGALTTAPVGNEVVVYSDAGHGFYCDERDAFHEESAEDGWHRTLEWFDAHLAPATP